MSVPLSAKNAVVRVNGSVVACKEWNVEPKVDALETTNFEGSGYGDYIAGIIDADITLTFDMDSAAFQTGNPPNLAAGATITNLLLYTNGVGSAKWTFPSALVVTSPMNAAVRDLLKGTATLKGKGIFSFG